MSKTVDYYFDFSSSYSYIGLYKLLELAERYELQVNWKPIALGAIFKNLNHAPPGSDSVKGRYIWHDVQRSAAEQGIPYHWPEPFPYNSMTAARIYWYLADKGAAVATDWMKAVFNASFGQGKDCSNPETLAEIAAELGHDGQELLAATKDDAVKMKLQQVTGEAMERGVFGAPTFFFDGEMYWGADRLNQMERQVLGND